MVEFNLKEKVVLIAGGSSGIGFAAAMQFIEEGCNVVIAARDQIKLNSLFKTRKFNQSSVHVLSVDLGTQKGIEDFIEYGTSNFKKIDILVNTLPLPFSTYSINNNISQVDWETALQDKLLSYIALMSSVLPLMKKNNWGRIINVAGITSKEPSCNLITSGVINAAIVNLTKSFSQVYSVFNICINVVNPGFVATERFDHFIEQQARAHHQNKYDLQTSIIQTIPARRLGRPDEIANLIVFLASDKAGYITGTSISVDGGVSKSTG